MDGTVTSVQQDSSYTVVQDDGVTVFVYRYLPKFNIWKGERIHLECDLSDDECFNDEVRRIK